MAENGLHQCSQHGIVQATGNSRGFPGNRSVFPTAKVPSSYLLMSTTAVPPQHSFDVIYTTGLSEDGEEVARWVSRVYLLLMTEWQTNCEI